MRAENCAIWNRRRFWCGAFDMRTLKVVEVHRYEECEALDFQSYWAFSGDGSGLSAEELFENTTWIFFWVSLNGRIDLQVEAEDINISPLKAVLYEGIKSFIRKQIQIKPAK